MTCGCGLPDALQWTVTSLPVMALIRPRPWLMTGRAVNTVWKEFIVNLKEISVIVQEKTLEKNVEEVIKTVVSATCNNDIY